LLNFRYVSRRSKQFLSTAERSDRLYAKQCQRVLVLHSQSARAIRLRCDPRGRAGNLVELAEAGVAIRKQPAGAKGIGMLSSGMIRGGMFQLIDIGHRVLFHDFLPFRSVFAMRPNNSS